MSHTPYIFQTARRIVAGAHSLDAIDEHITSIGSFRSALLLTQPSMVRSGAADKLVTRLRKAGIVCRISTDIKPEPTIQNVEDVHESVRNEAFDLYIGLGGGSVLDAAKLLAALRTNDMTISEMLGTNLVRRPTAPLVLIPTTSGTGSEVTPNAIVTLPDEQLKVGVISPFLLPDLVILDPVLTVGLPPSITAATGMDAFTHSLESYISNKANPISDTFALESIRLISRSIQRAYHHGEDIQAREDMLVGSMLGGMALTAAGTAAVHALAYPLGGTFHIPHGVANSMLLPHVMAFNQDAIVHRLGSVAQVMMQSSVERLTPEDSANFVVSQIQAWTKELQIPQNLTVFGVRHEDVEQLAVAAAKVTRLLNNNPKKLELSDMERIYRKLLADE